MQSRQIDYSALSEPVTRTDIQAYKERYPNTSKTSTVVIVGILFAFVIFMLIGSLSSARNVDALMILAIFFVIFGIPGIAIFWASRSTFKRRVKLYKFSQKNEVQLLINRLDPPYAGMIFGIGHSRKVKEALVFNEGVELGNYTYATGSGKSRSEYHWGYIRVPLTRRLPHMVLDAKKNNYLNRFSNLSQGFSKDQILKLEGDFNEFFTLYAPKEYETDALYVFTPDVMAALIDFGADYDVEIVEDNFIMYAKNHLPLASSEHLQKIITVTQTISSELRDQSRRYADERVGDRAANMIALPGQRLKSGIKAGTVILFIVVLAYFAWILLSDYM